MSLLPKDLPPASEEAPVPAEIIRKLLENNSDNVIAISTEVFNAGLSMGLNNDTMYAYAISLKRHIDFVSQAAVELLGIDAKEVKSHDRSKWSVEEFPFYAKHFHGGGDPVGFARAWHHHLRNNCHHWQYWIFPDNFSLEGSDVVDGCLPMPQKYLQEMVADWLGASMAYTGSWDMTSWLDNNLSKVRLHPDSKYRLNAILLEFGYRIKP